MIKKKDNEKEEIKNTIAKYEIENLNLTCIVEKYKNNTDIFGINGNNTINNEI